MSNLTSHELEISGGDRTAPTIWGNGMKEIVGMQKVLMDRLGHHPNKMSVEEKEALTKEMIVCIVAELGEVLERGINWKHWKKQRIMIDCQYLLEEFIDLLHFVIELFLIWGFEADDILEAFEIKHNENMRRQAEDY